MRCSACAAWLRFEGVQTRGNGGPVWVRWDACDSCRRWYLRRDNGTVYGSTAIGPTIHTFRPQGG